MATPEASPSSICYSILTSILAAVAFLLAWSVEFGCSFLSFTTTSGFNEPVTVKFGIWSYQFWTVATSVGGSVIFETCHSYPSDVAVDGNWKAARAFSTLTLIIGGGFLLRNLITGCVAPLRRASQSEPPAFLLAAIFQGLSLLLLNSTLCTNNQLLVRLQSEAEKIGNADMDFPDTCSVSVGANCAIAAVVFWFLAALTSSMATVAEKRDASGGGAVITESLLPGDNL